MFHASRISTLSRSHSPRASHLFSSSEPLPTACFQPPPPVASSSRCLPVPPPVDASMVAKIAVKLDDAHQEFFGWIYYDHAFYTGIVVDITDAAIEQAKWNSSKVSEKLRRYIDAHVASVCAKKISELTSLYEGKLNKALAEPVEALLDTASDDTCPAIRRLLQRERNSALSDFASALSSFDIDHGSVDKLLAKLEDHARSVVESKVFYVI